jgi:hypothetical protein
MLHKLTEKKKKKVHLHLLVILNNRLHWALYIIDLQTNHFCLTHQASFSYNASWHLNILHSIYAHGDVYSIQHYVTSLSVTFVTKPCFTLTRLPKDFFASHWKIGFCAATITLLVSRHTLHRTHKTNTE